MRSAAVIAILASAVAVASVEANAAEVPSALLDMRAIDKSGSDLAKRVGDMARLTVERRRNMANVGTPAPLPGWSATLVGDTLFLQDDGTHGCDGDLSESWFYSCMAGTDAALDAFYALYPDANPGYASFYLGWDIGAFFAFYSPVANDVDGIGSPKHGNPSSLNGLIFMNSIDLYRSYGDGNREFVFDMIWGQEFGHRWGSFVTFIDEDGDKSGRLLGRDDSHWSYFLDTDWSWMEGNDWRDNDDGSFTTEFGTFGDPGYGYSQLDLYLMGFIPPSAVDDFFYIEPEATSIDPEDPPAIMMGQPKTIEGRRVRVGLDQVIEAEGERDPAFHESKRHFQVANIVILRSTDTLTAAMQDDMNDYTEWTSTHFKRDSLELAHVETTIGEPLPNSNPVAALSLPESAKAGGDAVTLDASASTDPESEKLTYVWDFGDGTADYTSGAVVEHVFERSGDLTVNVTVVDARGRSHSTSGTLEVAKADGKGGDNGVLGIGCSVTGTPIDAIPPVSAALLAAAGVLGVVIRRRSRAI